MSRASALRPGTQRDADWREGQQLQHAPRKNQPDLDRIRYHWGHRSLSLIAWPCYEGHGEADHKNAANRPSVGSVLGPSGTIAKAEKESRDGEQHEIFPEALVERSAGTEDYGCAVLGEGSHESREHIQRTRLWVKRGVKLSIRIQERRASVRSLHHRGAILSAICHASKQTPA